METRQYLSTVANELIGGVTVQNQDRYIEFQRVLKELTALDKLIKEATLKSLVESDTKKIESDSIVITRVDGSQRETFDTKAFRAEYPTLYDDFVKITETAPSVRIKVKHGSVDD